MEPHVEGSNTRPQKLRYSRVAVDRRLRRSPRKMRIPDPQIDRLSAFSPFADDRSRRTYHAITYCRYPILVTPELIWERLWLETFSIPGPRLIQPRRCTRSSPKSNNALLACVLEIHSDDSTDMRSFASVDLVRVPSSES